ncbi:MAG: hypothetical protein A2X81_08705 [Desulfobacterales bacterium GWB2_56_26]|nr:MAG: hypothetical protein A2X81_08705 [Desulfobacterales bacterium GWB2_56_26]
MAGRRKISRVGGAGVTVALAGLVLGDFVLVRRNRLTPGVPLSVFEALAELQWALLLAGLAALLLFSIKPGRRQAAAGMLLIVLLVLALLGFLGSAAAELSEAGGSFTRVSIGSSMWLALFGLFIVLTDMVGRARLGLVGNVLLAVGFVAGLAFSALAGAYHFLSPVLEFISHRDRFFAELGNHLFITSLSIGLAAAIGLPLGLLIFKYRSPRASVFAVLNIVQTVPSLALFGLLIAPLAFISGEWPLLRSLGVRGIGWAPAVIALTLYGLLPIVRNTFAGFAAVDKAVMEVGRGMGMGPLQIFARVELPIAAPIILSGLRIACVQNIGNTAVAALIGAGGFGIFIFQGLGQSAIDLILLGTIPTIVLALCADGLFQMVMQLFTYRRFLT